MTNIKTLILHVDVAGFTEAEFQAALSAFLDHAKGGVGELPRGVGTFPRTRVMFNVTDRGFDDVRDAINKICEE